MKKIYCWIQKLSLFFLRSIEKAKRILLSECSSYLAPSQNFEKRQLTSLSFSVCPSICLENLDGIWYHHIL